jgi:AcrR family transcriptional regulator
VNTAIRSAKERILDAAQMLLRTNSPIEVWPSTIANASGLRPSLVHYHYPEIQRLLCAATVQAYEEHAQESRSILSGEAPAWTALRAWLELQRKWATANRGAAAIILAPHIYGLDNAEGWRRVEKFMIDGLVPLVLETHPGQTARSSAAIAKLYQLTGLIIHEEGLVEVLGAIENKTR